MLTLQNIRLSNVDIKRFNLYLYLYILILYFLIQFYLYCIIFLTIAKILNLLKLKKNFLFN